MVEDDIYESKKKYLQFVANYQQLVIPILGKTKQYYCKNPDNIQYVKKLIGHFEIQDNSYVRRLRMLGSMKVILFATEKKLSAINDNDDRDEINEIIRFARTRYSDYTMKCFIIDLRFIWRLLFPEKDAKGRVDESITPYVVRHLKNKIDPSRAKRRKDFLSFEEYTKILTSFNNDVRCQAFLALLYESLGRPQEVLYLRIKDVELYDNYGKAFISEHGKEGIGILRIIESYPYILKWIGGPQSLDSFRGRIR